MAVAVHTWDRQRDRASVYPVGPGGVGTWGRAKARVASVLEAQMGFLTSTQDDDPTSTILRR